MKCANGHKQQTINKPRSVQVRTKLPSSVVSSGEFKARFVRGTKAHTAVVMLDHFWTTSLSLHPAAPRQAVYLQHRTPTHGNSTMYRGGKRGGQNTRPDVVNCRPCTASGATPGVRTPVHLLVRTYKTKIETETCLVAEVHSS
jgi:hypothetical protein